MITANIKMLLTHQNMFCFRAKVIKSISSSQALGGIHLANQEEGLLNLFYWLSVNPYGLGKV